MSLIDKYLERKFPEKHNTVCNHCHTTIAINNVRVNYIVKTVLGKRNLYTCPKCKTLIIDESLIEEIDNK